MSYIQILESENDLAANKGGIINLKEKLYLYFVTWGSMLNLPCVVSR